MVICTASGINSKCIGLLFCPQSKFIGLRLLYLCQQYPNAYHSDQRTSQGRFLARQGLWLSLTGFFLFIFTFVSFVLFR